MRRAEALGLLFPTRFGLLPIGERVPGGLGLTPAAPRRIDRGLIVAVEHVDTAGILRHIVRFDAIDEKEDRRAVRVLSAIAEPDRLRRRIAVARRAVRQKTRVVIGPEERVQMLDALGRGGADHDAVALRAGPL